MTPAVCPSEQPGPDTDTAGLEFPRELPQAILVATRYWSLMDRRELLTTTGLAMAGWTTPIRRWLTTPADPLAAHTGTMLRVGAADVAELLSAADSRGRATMGLPLRRRQLAVLGDPGLPAGTSCASAARPLHRPHRPAVVLRHRPAILPGRLDQIRQRAARRRATPLHPGTPAGPRRWGRAFRRLRTRLRRPASVPARVPRRRYRYGPRARSNAPSTPPPPGCWPSPS